MAKTKPYLDFNSLKPKLIGVGFAFYGESEKADPELTLLQVIQIVREEPKLFRMLLSWLEKVHELIHVERLKVLAIDLNVDSWLALGILALKQVRNGDRRFSLLSELAKRNLQNKDVSHSCFSEESDEFLIEKYGVDLDLQEFGVRAQTVQCADPKKILALAAILEKNSWLRVRTLIGANFRADIAYVLSAKLAHNPYQAAKITRCSQETAYRLWRGLLLYPEIDKLAA
jgi:hypothetical protein